MAGEGTRLRAADAVFITMGGRGGGCAAVVILRCASLSQISSRFGGGL